MYRGKDCVEKFVENIEDEVKLLYASFPQQPMTELIDVTKKEHETARKCHIGCKEFNEPENTGKRSLSLQRLISQSNPKQLQPEISNKRLYSHCVS